MSENCMNDDRNKVECLYAWQNPTYCLCTCDMIDKRRSKLSDKLGLLQVLPQGNVNERLIMHKV